MLCCSVHCETRSALSPTQSSPDFCSLCFEDAEAILTDWRAVEPGSSEAYKGWVIDYSHPSATASADSTPVQDGSTLCIPSGAWTRDRSMHRFEACCSGFDRPGFGTLGLAECDYEPVACSHHTCSPSTSQ